ncbi:MAG: restriction endonuclease subunit S [Thermosynechococcaceae cyanobacterium MS004]|nr:restriction endonuclease subunit S [Thermosynechococcaceae cyanobacterium MS004]MCG9892336.1 restriction endonuclease subunit S [Thermosynechococcaceae cyanobacterium MS004]
MSSAQVPEGYKQTEVGVIPEDWEINIIGDIADVKTGPFGSVLHESDYVIDGTPIITVEHLGDFGVEHFNLPMVSDEDKDRLKLFSLKVGDIVFSRVGSIDRNALIGDSESGWLFSGRLLRVRLDSKINQPNYLSYHFHSKPFKQRVKAVAVGQTMPSLNTQILKGIQIVLPPLPEQKTIAQALSDVDALITSLDKLVAKQRQLKTAAMQQLLTGKMRLPGFVKEKGYKHTEIGVIPDDWGLTSLEKISAFITKGSTPTTYGFSWVQSGILFLRSECVSENGLDLSQSMFISQKAHTVLSRSELHSGDILITITGNVGRVVYLDNDFGVGNMNQHIARVRIVDNNVCAKFIYHFLTQSSVRKAFNTITTGQAYPQISLKQVRDAVIPLPSFPEQCAIAAVLSDMDTAIAALEIRRTKTQAIKQGMMQELLTGRTRLV